MSFRFTAIVLLIVLASIILCQCAYASDVDKSPFAICGLGLMFGREHPDWEGWVKEAALLKDAGINWTRIDFWWGVVEPEKDKFDWSYTDKMAAFFREQKINAMPILCYCSQWYKKPPDTDDERARYANFVYQVVKRYKGTYKVYEIWNEPNIPTFWETPNVRDYTLMLKEAYKAAKKADPDCIILAAATSGPDLTYIQGIFENGGWDYCDAISIHPYSMAGNPIQMRLDKILRIMNWYIAKTGKPKPLWITEMGWTTQNPREEKEQAIAIFQSYMISLANDVQRLFWFCYADWGENWGIVKGFNPFDPKPSYNAYKLMTRYFEGTKFEGYLQMPQGLACYVFKKTGKERILAVWSQDETLRTVKLPQTEGLTAVDIYGKPVMIGNGIFAVEDLPVIVTGADANRIGKVSRDFNPNIDPKGTNLIVNSSMESKSLESCGGWNPGRFHNRHKDATYTVVKEGRNASTCLSISKSKGSMAWDNQLIPVYPGAKSRMTGWIRTENATGENCLSLTWYSGNMWTPFGEARTKAITGTKDWTYVTVEGTVPANSMFLRPEIVSQDNSGTAFFDDVTVAEE